MPGGKAQPKLVSRPPGSRAGPVCELRVQEDGVVALCRRLSSLQLTLRVQPPAPPAPVLCHPARLGAAFA